MANEITLSVKADMEKAIASLQSFRAKLEETGDAFKQTGTQAADSISGATKTTETALGKMGSLGKKVLGELKKDFMAMASLGSLVGGLKLASQFGSSIKETLNLNDAIRKLGASFGIGRESFSKFQADLTRGMGDIGMSSEEAANVLKGLAGQGITGQGNVTAYSQTSAQLASLGGERGKGGDIAASLASVVRAQGGNVNDPKQMMAVAKQIAKAMESTGKSATELLSGMQDVFQSMPEDLRKRLGPQAMGQMAVASTVAGPQATLFMKEYLKLSKEQRQGLDAQGLGKVFDKNGQINLRALKEIQKEMKARGLSPREAAKSFGFTDEAAEGLTRLIEASDRVQEAFDRTAKASDDIAGKTRKNMGVSESFQASINKVKSAFAGPLSDATQSMADMLGKASETTTGAVGVTAGAGILAAILGGGGLRGIGKSLDIPGMVIGQAKKQAYEELTGSKVQDVYVTNASDIGGGGIGTGAIAGMGAMATMAGGAVAGAAGFLGGKALNTMMGQDVSETAKSVGFSDEMAKKIEELTDAISAWGAKMTGMHSQPSQKITIDNKTDFRVKALPKRGAQSR